MNERVIVCGGRDYQNVAAVNVTLDALHAERGIELVIEGGAAGADSLAQDWAVMRNIDSQSVHADWSQHGKAAGPIRNAKMLKLQPTLVVVFPGGRGTADMERRATAANIRVLRVAQ